MCYNISRTVNISPDKGEIVFMAEFEAGKEIISLSTPNNIFYIIAEGSVNAMVRGHNISLKKGDIVGIFDITMPLHTCQYTAAEDCSLIPYPFEDTDSLLALFDRNSDLRKLFILSFCRNIVYLVRDCQNSYKECVSLHHYVEQCISQYHDICHSIGLSGRILPFMDNIQPLDAEDTPDFYLEDFYTALRKIIGECKTDIPSNFVYGFLTRSREDINHMLTLSDKFLEYRSTYSDYLLNEDYLDIYDIYCDIFLRAQNNGATVTSIDAAVTGIVDNMRGFPSVNPQLLAKRVFEFRSKTTQARQKGPESKEDASIREELNNSLTTILKFAAGENGDSSSFDAFAQLVEDFKKVTDRNSTDKQTDTLRRQLTKAFYVVFNEVVKHSLTQDKIPTIVKMFLNFGYVDPTLCGFDNALELYKITENHHGLKDEGIYTFHEWILEIYKGNKQPSRNEFEQDYADYIRNLKRERKIDKAAEARMLNDNMGKVMYELQNVFPQVNKVTFGRIFSYCPLLLEEDILRSLDALLLTPRKVLDTFDKLLAIDYSAFYHEVLYEDSNINLKEPVQIDIRPDVILLPNAGSKGILWQEIEGMYRTTPGRMMISALHTENPDKSFLRMTAEFRWEMCKRAMGARWNDFTSHSLTSDYCSYAQFFSKSRDLSFDAKEKIKELQKRCKNSYKEMFVRDYMIFVQNESTGSSRLNKVVRGILFQHCPFTKEICNNLQGNGAFIDCLNKYRIRQGQHMHHLNQVLAKYQSMGKPVPEEIASQKELFER